MSAVIGTAGHIDHGKTALVRALTGEDTDRLPEEKRRGISIDLGFSRLELDGSVHGIVDVPGHEDFIRNMLAGASGIDLLILVVAADEGVMPQTREHVAIATLLQVPRAVVALTKSDLVEEEWLALVRDDVRSLLADTPFRAAPMVPVASPSGAGIDALRSALAEALDARLRDADDLLRLPVDRVFTVKGTGTVVTGTIWSGALATDDTVRIEPGGRAARVRSLQVHGADVDRAAAGQRAAVALSGIDRESIQRGATLVADRDHWTPASILTVRLEVLPGSDWSLEQRQRVRVHLGTAEVMARIRLLEESRLDPGMDGWAQLRLESPLVARTGDRCVIRSYSPVTTIAGARVAEPAAAKRKRLDPPAAARLADTLSGDPARRLSAVVAEAGPRGVSLASLPIRTGLSPSALSGLWDTRDLVVAGDRAFPAQAEEKARNALRAAVEAYHQRWPLRPGIELEELRRSAEGAPELIQHALEGLIADGEAQGREGRIARAGYTPVPDQALSSRIARVEALVRDAGAAPPEPEEIVTAAGEGPEPLDEILRYMEAEKRIVRLQPGVYLHPETVRRVAEDVRRALGGRTGLGPADFREVVNVSRKHLIPILEYLDLTGVTVRHGDGRAVVASAP